MFSILLTISWSGHLDLSHSNRASFLKAAVVPLWFLWTAAMVAAFLTISIIPVEEKLDKFTRSLFFHATLHIRHHGWSMVKELVICEAPDYSQNILHSLHIKCICFWPLRSSLISHLYYSILCHQVMRLIQETHSTNFIHETQFTHHKDYFTAFENSCIMSSVVLRDLSKVFLSFGAHAVWKM